MTSGDYLDKILDRMTSTHNITRNFTADGWTFAAYALYEASSEKYVLSRKANLWKVSESEHVLFMTLPENADPGADSEADSGAGPGANSSADPEALFKEAGRLISDYMEEVPAQRSHAHISHRRIGAGALPRSGTHKESTQVPF